MKFRFPPAQHLSWTGPWFAKKVVNLLGKPATGQPGPMKQSFSNKTHCVVTCLTAIPFVGDMNIELKKIRTAGTVAKNSGKIFGRLMKCMTVVWQKIGLADQMESKRGMG